MTENFPILMLDTKPQIQKAQKIPGRINDKEHRGISFSKYKKIIKDNEKIIFKVQKIIKDNEKILKESRG